MHWAQLWVCLIDYNPGCVLAHPLEQEKFPPPLRQDVAKLSPSSGSGMRSFKHTPVLQRTENEFKDIQSLRNHRKVHSLQHKKYAIKADNYKLWADSEMFGNSLSNCNYLTFCPTNWKVLKFIDQTNWILPTFYASYINNLKVIIYVL